MSQSPKDGRSPAAGLGVAAEPAAAAGATPGAGLEAAESDRDVRAAFESALWQIEHNTELARGMFLGGDHRGALYCLQRVAAYVKFAGGALKILRNTDDGGQAIGAVRK